MNYDKISYYVSSEIVEVSSNPLFDTEIMNYEQQTTLIRYIFGTDILLYKIMFQTQTQPQQRHSNCWVWVSVKANDFWSDLLRSRGWRRIGTWSTEPRRTDSQFRTSGHRGDWLKQFTNFRMIIMWCRECENQGPTILVARSSYVWSWLGVSNSEFDSVANDMHINPYPWVPPCSCTIWSPPQANKIKVFLGPFSIENPGFPRCWVPPPLFFFPFRTRGGDSRIWVDIVLQ